jgi:cytochrome oxidase Cu insertion factor (SCO1/SenC/PrrC family)
MKVKIAGALAFLIFGLSCGPNRDAPPDGLVQRTSPVQVGETAPDFTLEDQHQQKVTLSSARDLAPTVLVFYRGHW